jgi:ribosomal protein S18 acetylase RimI-like enzyme
MNFTIRIAEPQDVPMLTELFNSDTNIFGEDGTGFGERDISEYVTDKKKRLLVCETNNRVVGALMADYHNTYSHLETLIVDRAFQGKGIGSALLNFYEADLEKLGIPLIEVLTEIENERMQVILSKRGFRKGNTFVFYSKGE